MRPEMIGQTIGSYRITAQLGTGGMGAVYLGEHVRIARKAAIKVLLPEFTKNDDIVDRFFREALATSRIRHPGIVEILDCNLLPDGSAYIVMELLEGETLGTHLRRSGRLSVQRSVFLTRHVADALAAAHDEKIIHRDLKPDNIFVMAIRPSGPQQPTKVVDFGIAKLINTHGPGSERKTRTGSILGTPVYMSPEQCRGTGEIDPRSDIYSLGCVLFEMLAGRPPFTHEGFGELIQSHLSVTPPALRSFDPAFPPALDHLVARLLAKSPADRPQTMRALMTELDAIAAGEPPMTISGEPVVRVETQMLPGAPHTVGPTVLPAQMPKIQTTLRSASAEKIEAVSSEDPLTVARSPRKGLFVGIGLAAVAAVGIGAWRATTSSAGAPLAAVAHDTSNLPTQPAAPPPSAATAPVTVAPAPAPTPAANLPNAPLPNIAAASTPPTSRRTEPPPAANGATAGPGVPRETRSASASSSTRTAKPAASFHRVRLEIASTPPGADICLASDRVLLGRTPFEWTTEKSSRDVKLLVRKTGYRGEDLLLAPSGDSTKRVELSKLGPDDIDDLQNCKSR